MHGRISPVVLETSVDGVIALRPPDRTASLRLAYVAPEQTGRLSRAEDARPMLSSGVSTGTPRSPVEINLPGSQCRNGMFTPLRPYERLWLWRNRVA
jgi:hypothetical protein